MVRRDATERLASSEDTFLFACCALLAGGSPVPVGAEAPGSRLRVRGEILAAQAERREPLRREQQRGPQHEVKLAASKEKQSGSRAAHVTAKATSGALVSERAPGPGGVRSAARVEREAWNTRDPSASPPSGQGASYKPKAKSSAAQRESEGLVVPSRVAQNNATGGKGPCFGHARSEGKREGMAAQSGPNDPGARTCDEEVRQPQRGLWAGAERRLPQRPFTNEHARSDARGCVTSQSGRAAVHAPSRRPSVSRVREIRTHGLKGGSALSPMNNRSSR
jgi:hypothetical protein